MFTELIYCGCILEDDTTLESCGLKNGAMIHVLRKKTPEEPVLVKPFSDNNISQLSSAFRSFNENPALRSALHVSETTSKKFTTFIIND